MTFRVYFFADQLFFQQVKDILEENSSSKLDFNRELSLSANAIILLHSGIEACLNLIGIGFNEIDFEDFERKALPAKIEFLYQHSKLNIDWSKKPLQGVKRTCMFRNWLVHYKDPNIGLLGSFGYLKELNFSRSKLKPEELRLKLIENYYKNSLETLRVLVLSLGIQESFEYLFTEVYNPILAG